MATHIIADAHSDAWSSNSEETGTPLLPDGVKTAHIVFQTNYALYRPAAVVIANTLSDIPFSAVRTFVFNIIVYFMSGLSRTAGGFFTYHLFVCTDLLLTVGRA